MVINFWSSLVQAMVCNQFGAKLVHCELNPLNWTASFHLQAHPFDLQAQKEWVITSAGSECIYWVLGTPYGDKVLVTNGSSNDLSPVRCQAIACRIGVNSIEELEMKLNCDSSPGIGIETGHWWNWKYWNWNCKPYGWNWNFTTAAAEMSLGSSTWYLCLYLIEQ